MKSLFKTMFFFVLIVGNLANAVDQAINTEEKRNIVCDKNEKLIIQIMGLDFSFDDVKITEEAVKCFHKNAEYKNSLKNLMLNVAPKQNFWKCNLEKNDLKHMLLTSWESGRPAIDFKSESEDPIGITENSRSLLIREDIYCSDSMSTGLYSGIQGGISFKISIEETRTFRMISNADKSQVITVKFDGIVKDL